MNVEILFRGLMAVFIAAAMVAMMIAFVVAAESEEIAGSRRWFLACASAALGAGVLASICASLSGFSS